MTQAKTGDRVQLHYTGRLKDGTVFDSSIGGDPVELTLGDEVFLPTLEKAVTGMSPGDSKVLEILAAEAYGPHDTELVQEIDRSALPQKLDPRAGTRLRASGPNRQSLVLTIVEVKEDTVTLDANHPLAGRDLTFEVELLAII